MKNLKEIADKHLEITTGTLRGRVFDAMQEYADIRVKQAVNEALRMASEEANLKQETYDFDGLGETETRYIKDFSVNSTEYSINKQSILSLAPKVLDKLK